jgi:hypothetical protein
MLRNAPICSRRHSPMGMRYRLESNTCAQQLSSHPKINRKTEQMSASARRAKSEFPRNLGGLWGDPRLQHHPCGLRVLLY